jgi:hypothetical protein
MRRHLLDRPAMGTDAVSIVERLCGVQAQVMSSAELAVAVRQAKPAAGEVNKALKAKRLIKTWAVRGTLHLLTPRQAPALLALMAATKAWEKPCGSAISSPSSRWRRWPRPPGMPWTARF